MLNFKLLQQFFVDHQIHLKNFELHTKEVSLHDIEAFSEFKIAINQHIVLPHIENVPIQGEQLIPQHIKLRDNIIDVNSMKFQQYNECLVPLGASKYIIRIIPFYNQNYEIFKNSRVIEAIQVLALDQFKVIHQSLLFTLIDNILNAYPNLKELCVSEELFDQQEIQSSNILSENLKLQILRFESIRISGMQYYLDIIQRSKNTLRDLHFDAASYSYQNMVRVRETEIKFCILEYLQGLTKLEKLSLTGRPLNLPSKDIDLLPSLTNLTSLSVEWFAADYMQTFLEMQLLTGLAKLRFISLGTRLPDPAKALRGKHRNLMEIKYMGKEVDSAYANGLGPLVIQNLTLQEVLDIVEGKKYGLIFYGPIQNVQSLQELSPHVLINHNRYFPSDEFN
ncbi:hypothetical protein FGO68_gene3185 [Halteria grandinella]|uniref:Uncharacterized protein n=1 Tax=Halteria grandinella TaxID=5974 RepID=A0A8J8T5G8_HALGN|nr:hypothetical protein FGO68_gene3185 [Halteria grandinella]